MIRHPAVSRFLLSMMAQDIVVGGAKALTLKLCKLRWRKALSKVADEPITVVCSGRTDSGVHASSQICHFDTVAHRDPYNWVMGVNTQHRMIFLYPGPSGSILIFMRAFCARSRRYVYLIRQSSFRSALLRNSITFTHKCLDPELMAEAGRSLLGTHDFNAYRSAQCQAKTSVRTLTHLGVHCHEGLIAVHVEANGFAKHGPKCCRRFNSHWRTRRT